MPHGGHRSPPQIVLVLERRIEFNICLPGRPIRGLLFLCEDGCERKIVVPCSAEMFLRQEVIANQHISFFDSKRSPIGRMNTRGSNFCLVLHQVLPTNQSSFQNRISRPLGAVYPRGIWLDSAANRSRSNSTKTGTGNWVHGCLIQRKSAGHGCGRCSFVCQC